MPPKNKLSGLVKILCENPRLEADQKHAAIHSLCKGRIEPAVKPNRAEGEGLPSRWKKVGNGKHNTAPRGSFVAAGGAR